MAISKDVIYDFFVAFCNEYYPERQIQRTLVEASVDITSAGNVEFRPTGQTNFDPFISSILIPAGISILTGILSGVITDVGIDTWNNWKLGRKKERADNAWLEAQMLHPLEECGDKQWVAVQSKLDIPRNSEQEELARRILEYINKLSDEELAKLMVRLNHAAHHQK